MLIDRKYTIAFIKAAKKLGDPQTITISVSNKRLGFSVDYFNVKLSWAVRSDEPDTDPLQVPLDPLYRVLKSLKSVTVEAKKVGEKLMISSLSPGRTDVFVSDVTLTQHPISALDPVYTSRIAGPEFKAAVLRQLPGSDGYTNRFGVLFRANEKQAVLVSTDGHRLASHAMPSTFTQTPFEIRIPQEVIEVVRLMVGLEDVGIRSGNGLAKISWKNFAIEFKPFDQEYPDYMALIPKNPTTTVLVDSQPLFEMFRELWPLDKSNQRRRPTTLLIGNHSIRVTGMSRYGNYSHGPIDASNNKSITIGVDLAYLRDAVLGLRCEKIRIECTHPLAPIIISDAEDESQFSLVMPMRID